VYLATVEKKNTGGGDQHVGCKQTDDFNMGSTCVMREESTIYNLILSTNLQSI